MTEVRLGSINGSHGVKGWVKVFSYTDPVTAILDYSSWVLSRGRESREVKVLEGRLSGKRLLARLEGVDTRDMADELIGYEVTIAQSELPKLQAGEYYWRELEGLVVRSESGQVFGEINHLLETGANDVMVVHPTSTSVDDQERLIPFVEGEVVKRVDTDAGELVVDWDADY